MWLFTSLYGETTKLIYGHDLQMENIAHTGNIMV